ncbi:transglutaminase family protein [Caulobacter sp. DWR1-3-2b1]|uniref:transglutaminase family protein n=1 Tax=Caulobacter sp. DWR1-3-2b1 TaxID=2804670 RepID=UPI003CF6BB51
MPVLSVRHLTHYRYRNPVAFGDHRMMLRPREGCDQRLLSSSLLITPNPVQLRYVQDVLGNWVGVAHFQGRSSELSFESQFTLDHTPLPAFGDVPGHVDVYQAGRPFAYSSEDLPDLVQSIAPQHDDPDGVLTRWGLGFVKHTGETSLQHLLAEMTQAIYADFRYGKRLESGVQTPLATLESRGGTCRDFAVLMIEAVRRLGLAAQFVSGYIHCPLRGLAKAAGRTGGGHTHAWLRVYLPSCGWVEFDPTNGIVGNTDLIRVAVVRDPRQAPPIHGTWAGFPTDYLSMDVEVDVTSIEDHLAPALATAFG